MARARARARAAEGECEEASTMHHRQAPKRALSSFQVDAAHSTAAQHTDYMYVYFQHLLLELLSTSQPSALLSLVAFQGFHLFPDIMEAFQRCVMILESTSTEPDE